MTVRKRTTERTKRSNYSPNPREVSAIIRFKNELEKKAPRLKFSRQGDVLNVGPDHPDNAIGRVLLMEALGTTDQEFTSGLLKQLVDASYEGGRPDEDKVNFMLSVIKGIKPRDQTEAMIAAQMAAVHVSAMALARRLANVESIPQQDSAERAFNKLTRTFATQMEALKRYRTGGEQKVTVQHVTVSEGGQAIVGNVTQNARDTASKNIPAKPRALAPPTEQPMEILAAASPGSSPVKRKSRK
jgi:hypothetical protein